LRVSFSCMLFRICLHFPLIVSYKRLTGYHWWTRSRWVSEYLPYAHVLATLKVPPPMMVLVLLGQYLSKPFNCPQLHYHLMCWNIQAYCNQDSCILSFRNTFSWADCSRSTTSTSQKSACGCSCDANRSK
jgi:hypothetical protein